MDSIELSIIILTCHRIDRCHDSLLHNQAALAHRACEWWIINNGGTDFSLPDGLTQPTHLLQMPTNLGTAARNKAQPNGRYVLMLDDDAYIEQETIDSAIREMEQNPGAGGVILPVEGEGCLLQTVFHGCAVLFSTPVLNIINGYPDHYLYYGEEYDVAFRMTAANFHMRPTLQDVPSVRHVRDSGGRNIDHIMYRLIRNNAYCWIRCLPWREILPALLDTLHRYNHVSRKEKARAGFWRGVRAVPYALWRGLRNRSPMTQQQFEHIAMFNQLKELRPINGSSELILCGIGKFMRSTIQRLQQQGWNIIAIAETNPSFLETKLRKIPVITKEEALTKTNTWILTGLLAAPANRRWINEFKKKNYEPINNGEIQILKPMV